MCKSKGKPNVYLLLCCNLIKSEINFLFCPWFLFKKCLKDFMERRKDREEREKVFHLLAQSLNYHKGQSWPDPKLGASSWFVHGYNGPWTWAILGHNQGAGL